MLNLYQNYSLDSYKENILEVIDADALPAFLGGNLTDPDGNPMCHTLVSNVLQVRHLLYANLKI